MTKEMRGRKRRRRRGGTDKNSQAVNVNVTIDVDYLVNGLCLIMIDSKCEQYLPKNILNPILATTVAVSRKFSQELMLALTNSSSTIRTPMLCPL